MVRFYISLTAQCNVECPFCCMWSSPRKQTSITESQVASILSSSPEDFEFQLEGGEPLLHPQFFDFIEMAIETGRCKKIVVNTNGLILRGFMPRLIALSREHQLPIVIKRSINYHLLTRDPHIFERSDHLMSLVQEEKFISVMFNVRIRHGEEDQQLIVEPLKEHGLFEASNVFFLQRYGKFEDEEEYDEPFIRQNIDDWWLYASDGTCFDKDLVARSKYEQTLQ